MGRTSADGAMTIRAGGSQATSPWRQAARRGARLGPLALGALLIAGLATPVLAAGPERTPFGEETIPYDGYCDFPVLLEDSHASVKELAFPPDSSGALRYMYPGVYQSKLTNLWTNATTTVVIGSNVVFTVRPDDTALAVGSGSLLLYYTADDASISDVGSGLFLGRGHGTETYDEDGLLVRATFKGSLVDLCAVLGG